MYYFKSFIRLAVTIFFGMILTGCMHKYNLLPDSKPVALNKEINKVYVYGPYKNLEVHTGAKQPRILMTTNRGGQLTEVVVKQYADVLKVVPTRAAIPNDLRHITLKIYVSKLNELVIDQADTAQIYTVGGAYTFSINNTKQATLYSGKNTTYSLETKNVGYFLLKGGAVLSHLGVNNTANFDATEGPIYVNTIHFVGPSNAVIENIRGGSVSINAKGPGYLKLQGTYTLMSIIQRGSNFILLDGKINGGNIHVAGEDVANLEMNGINFSGLSFLANAGAIRVAGYVGDFKASLHGTAELDGQYLTTKQADVKTYDDAVAKLHASKRIFAKAEGKSRIEYTGYPKYRYAYAKDAGAILPLSPPPPNALNKGDWSIK